MNHFLPRTPRLHAHAITFLGTLIWAEKSIAIMRVPSKGCGMILQARCMFPDPYRDPYFQMVTEMVMLILIQRRRLTLV